MKKQRRLLLVEEDDNVKLAFRTWRHSGPFDGSRSSAERRNQIPKYSTVIVAARWLTFPTCMDQIEVTQGQIEDEASRMMFELHHHSRYLGK